MKSRTSSSTVVEPSFFTGQILEARRFYLDLSHHRSEHFSVVSGGVEHCRPDYRVQRSGFRYLSIEFVAAGQGTLELGGKRYKLCAGDIFAYGPRVSHDIRSDARRPLIKYFVGFQGSKSRTVLRRSGLTPGKVQHTSSPQDVLRIFEDLIHAGLRPTPFRRAICSCIVEHLLLRIAETAISSRIHETAAFETYRRCHDFIKTHYLDLHGLNDIAEQCGINPAYLCRLFNRFDYEGPYQFLTRSKIIRAAEELQIPGMLVKQVASRCGFSDPFNFSRTFRRVLGVSPKNFAQLLSSE